MTTVLHSLLFGLVGFAVAWIIQDASRHYRDSQRRIRRRMDRIRREQEYRERSSWYDWR